MIVSFSNLKSFACMDNRFPFHTALSYVHICVRIFDGKIHFYRTGILQVFFSSVLSFLNFVLYFLIQE